MNMEDGLTGATVAVEHGAVSVLRVSLFLGELSGAPEHGPE